MAEVACPAPLGPGDLIWTDGLGRVGDQRQGSAAGQGELSWEDPSMRDTSLDFPSGRLGDSGPAGRSG